MLSAASRFSRRGLQKRINWLCCFDVPGTYDRAMRLQALARLPKKQYEPWVRRDLMTLCEAQTTEGNFPASYTGGAQPEGYGDNANGQYAVLGLWAAERCGQRVPEEVWGKLDKYWREAQSARPATRPRAGRSTRSSSRRTSARMRRRTSPTASSVR
jgi:hypothetical protein